MKAFLYLLFIMETEIEYTVMEYTFLYVQKTFTIYFIYDNLDGTILYTENYRDYTILRTNEYFHRDIINANLTTQKNIS